jgi:predicted dehydrogenase
MSSGLGPGGSTGADGGGSDATAPMAGATPGAAPLDGGDPLPPPVLSAGRLAATAAAGGGGGPPASPTFREALETTRVCDAIVKSGKSGKWVAVGGGKA